MTTKNDSLKMKWIPTAVFFPIAVGALYFNSIPAAILFCGLFGIHLWFWAFGYYDECKEVRS